MFHSRICWNLIKYITALFATFTSSDCYHKYGLVEEWTLLEGLSKTNTWEPLSWKTWLARFTRAGGQEKDHYSMGLRNRVSRLMLVRWHQGWNHFVLFQVDQLLPCFFDQEDLDIPRDKKYAMIRSLTFLSDANLTIVTGCHCVMLRSSPWLVRQDKDIVLFLLTCGSRLDLVDLLGKDLALILSTC